MSYKAEISRTNPGCFVFLVDESGSMEDPFGGTERKKADELAVIINRLIHNLSIRCAKSDSIYDYFYVSVLGYSGDAVRSVFGGPLAGKDSVPIGELANNPLRIDEKVKLVEAIGDAAPTEEKIKLPAWYDAVSLGGTPMCAALKAAQKIVEKWGIDHPTSFPPIVINISDGESTDGDPTADAQALCAMGTADGPALLLNVHLSSVAANPVELPSVDDGLPDEHAKKLYSMSSVLTPFMVGRARELGMPVDENSRGFVFNAQPMQVIQFLDIGTRPANLR